MADRRLFWGEAHDNTYQYADAPFTFDESLRRAASHLDFYCAAYYTGWCPSFEAGGHQSEKEKAHKLILEGWKPQEMLDREWAEVQRFTRLTNRPGEFVVFPGYEWQGDGSSGDHNVFFLDEGGTICRGNTSRELYAALRGQEAIAIPHHIAYRTGVRGKDWSIYDETISPFAEIFSVHGCSETDEEWLGLRSNSHMGPGVYDGTYEAAMDRGYHVGLICSTDNWGAMPGHYGRGCMACYAEELTRESLWKAFRQRHVYGVTGDRIELDFRLGDEAMMGDIVAWQGARPLRVRVRGWDAIDRIELLRNNRVIATHCHQGTWEQPQAGQRSRYVFRVEAGWGPRPGELNVGDRDWSGEIQVKGGRVTDWRPCWISPGQGRPELDGDTARFRLRSSPTTVTEPRQNATVFELEAEPGAELCVRLNRLESRGTIAEFARGSRELWYRDECVALLAAEAGIAPGSPEREDVYHHVGYKAKLHRPIPAAGYTASLDFTDDTPLTGEVHYRVRVEQRNGQRAWSSPIWVRPELRSRS